MPVEKDIDSIFCRAIEISSATARDEFVEQACDGNEILKARVEQLLLAHSNAQGFMDDSMDQTSDFTHSERPGTQIGSYKIRERLGTGGMGVVWAAEQKVPIRRKVALKVVKPGMDSAQVLARFEAEREALSMMDHPNIARVLDAGTTEKGRPYFVMELIHGVPITEYCVSQRLDVQQRLKVFIDVCRAIQHAHQKGIIHRDIKPSNVLITEHDGTPVPKVIDFGVAKALHQPLTDHSIYTGVFQAIGTLAYMSPEQATLSGKGVDTCADVYGLGVLLYELLTGTTPFDRRHLEEAAFDEALRIIREENAPAPSTRISSLGNNLSVSGRKDPIELGRSVSRDLDCIVMKALEKDRSRRYGTADAFAEDIERHLAHEPVAARPPSAIYRLSRLYQRNKALVGSLALVIVVLIFAAAGTTSGWVAASRKGEQAQELAEKAQEAEQLAQQSLQRLQERIVEQAILGAIMADNDVKQLIDDARMARVAPQKIKLIEGIFAYHNGQDAVAELKEAYENQRDDLIAKSMYAIAIGHAGEHSIATRLTEELRTTRVSRDETAMESLFRAYPLVLSYWDEAIPTYRRIVTEHPSWLAARMFLAGSLGVRATETGDIASVKEAIHHAMICEEVAPDSPFCWLACLHTYWIALDFDMEQKDALRERAAILARKLRDRPNWKLGTDVRAKFLRFETKELADAVAAMEGLFAEDVESQYVINYAATSYQLSDEAARRALRKIEESKSASPRSAAAVLIACLGGQPKAVDQSETDPYVVLNSCWGFLIKGDLPEVQRTCKAYLDLMSKRRRPPSWYSRGGEGGQRMIEFLAKPNDTSSQTALSNTSSLTLLDAQMIQLTLALYHCAKEDHDQATKLLKKVATTGPVYGVPRSWAIALLERQKCAPGKKNPAK